MHNAAFNPSDEQSEIGQPWSCVENGHAPLEMWRYILSRWSVSSRTCEASTYAWAAPTIAGNSAARRVAHSACAANAVSHSCEPLYPCIFIPSSASQG